MWTSIGEEAKSFCRKNSIWPIDLSIAVYCSAFSAALWCLFYYLCVKLFPRNCFCFFRFLQFSVFLIFWTSSSPVDLNLNSRDSFSVFSRGVLQIFFDCYAAREIDRNAVKFFSSFISQRLTFSSSHHLALDENCFDFKVSGPRSNQAIRHPVIAHLLLWGKIMLARPSIDQVCNVESFFRHSTPATNRETQKATQNNLESENSEQRRLA